MNINNVIEDWNAQADEFNQWDSLDEEEKINHTILMCASKAYAVALENDVSARTALVIHDAVIYD